MKYTLTILFLILISATLAEGNGKDASGSYAKEAIRLTGEELLPPNAKVGECYARVFVPPAYKTVSEMTLQRDASDRLTIEEPRFETVEEQVMIKEASERHEIIPAKFTWVEEKVMVQPEHTHLVEVPAVFETVTEKVIDQPAHTIWKKGSGPIQKIDNATGEIMCLVEVPATYKTITKRVLVQNATTTKVINPAKYITVKKQVMKSQPFTKKISIPAEFKTVKLQKMISPALAQRETIPEEFQTVSRTELITEGKMEWQAVLCETNTTPGLVSSLQQMLANKGYDPGPIDGNLGQKTMSAIMSYQKNKGLPVGQLTIETLQSLNVQF